MQVQDATSNAPLAVAYVPVTLYKQLREHGRAKIWAKVMDQKFKVMTQSMTDLTLSNRTLKFANRATTAKYHLLNGQIV